MRNPHTTWAGILSLGILAGLTAYLVSTQRPTTEVVMIMTSLITSTGLNALGNILARDGDK